jgi:phosphinothricin acetyltransferase
MALTVRVANIADAEAVAAIYHPIVRDSVISFEAVPPDAAEIGRRIETTLTQYPYLAACEEDEVLGYAYATRLRSREAYDWCTETSVYVAENARARGVGSALYRELLALLARQGYCRAYAVITLPNPGSVRLHESVGFTHAGTYLRQGYKHGKWCDVGWWDLALRDDEDTPPDIVPFSELDLSCSRE